MYGFKKKPTDYNLEVWKKCIHPDDRDFVIESCLAAHRGEKDYNIEFRILWPDNSIHWIKADGIVIHNINNEAVRMIGTNYDITELKLSKKKLESSSKELNSQTAKLIESEERFREFADTINTGVAVYKVINEGKTGNDYIIKDFNRYALEHENKAKDEVVGKKLKDIRPSIDDYGLINTFRQVWITGEPAFFPAKVYIDENFSNYYENRVFKLPSGEIVAVYDDVSERMRAEQELIAAKEKAEESDRLKSAFLANMSHEIRTPMNGILNFSSLLSYPDFSQEKKNDFIKIIQKSGHRLINTLDDIIEISKIEVGEYKITKKIINFNENIRDLISFFSKEALDKGLEVELIRPNESNLDTLYTDESKFQTIITNLIKNAIKFSDSGKITFGYELIAGEIKFFCKDQGIGIPSNRTEGIFNRFEQADLNTTRGYEGSGLGLAIAKAYVEMLGGRIWLESVVNEGSTFFFTLPLTMQSFKPLVKQVSVNKPQKNNTLTNRKVNILVVEDDAISASYLQIVLEKYCDNFYSVRTGQEAINILKKHSNIDLVLMDIKLPVMDGYETTRKIREFNQRVKIIAQTAYAFKRDRNKAIDAGCDDYITKPLARNKLLKIINKQLDN
jgi:signal transduction histidine kinase/CheY-like chemotaxis protein